VEARSLIATLPKCRPAAVASLPGSLGAIKKGKLQCETDLY